LKQSTVIVTLAVTCLALLTGCAAPLGPKVMKAHYTATPVKVDGRLDEDIWKTAQAYALEFDNETLKTYKYPMMEPGEVRLAWDDKYFYVAVKFHDSDIVAQGEADQIAHYTKGDTVELFLKPEGRTWYWELYATPHNKKSTIWYPARGRLGLQGPEKYTCGLRVAAQIKGTLNNWTDRDNYWTAEMAMPIKDLTARGEKFGPGSGWRILIGRYNYGRYTPWKELSCVPRLSRRRFHMLEEFSRVEFVR